MSPASTSPEPAVARYGEDGSADITTRQNIQLRGVLINDLPDIIKRLREVDITSVQSGMDNPRNVTGNALAGVETPSFGIRGICRIKQQPQMVREFGMVVSFDYVGDAATQ